MGGESADVTPRPPDPAVPEQVPTPAREASRRRVVAGPVAELRSFLRAALLDPVAAPVDEPPAVARRRRWVVAGTLLAGTAAVTWALHLPPGDPVFLAATLLLAVIWTAGALASGPLHLGRARTRSGDRDARAVVQSLALGALLLGIFLLGAALVARVPALRDPVQALLDHARYGPVFAVAALTALNGVAEELFFRGAVFAALPARYAVAGSALASLLATALSGVPLLVFAAAVLGLVTAMQRRVTGGVLGPVVTHLTWSLGMLFLLPILLDVWS